MLFNSVEFIFFLAITYSLYRVLPFRGQNWMLLAASYIFYGWWESNFLYLIVLSTVIDFGCGLMIEIGQISRSHRALASGYLLVAAFLFVTAQWNAISFTSGLEIDWKTLLAGSQIGWQVFGGTLVFVVVANLLYSFFTTLESPKRRQLFLWISIGTNLGILGFFKYFNFFTDSLEAAVGSLGIPLGSVDLNIVLPVGISFYTFQTMSYTIDIYRGKLQATHRFFDFALFVAFFPQLVAGPIERASELLPRLLKPRTIRLNQSLDGVFLILFGLFKKVAVADGVAICVDAIYETTGIVSWLDIVLATFFFAIQIYCDFSGYSDTARGVAKILGIELMVNFNLPYFARNPSEFWQRWHISLSTWFRDYVYIPLGGSRKGNRSTYVNLLKTMTLSGLWHGAGWTFVIWGGYHGLLLCVYRFVIPKSTTSVTNQNGSAKLKSLAAIVFTFILVSYGWLWFRANSIEQAIAFTQTLIWDIGNFSMSLPRPTLSAIAGMMLLFAYEILQYATGKSRFNDAYPPILRGAFYAAITVVLIMGTSNAPAQFIYFQF